MALSFASFVPLRMFPLTGIDCLLGPDYLRTRHLILWTRGCFQETQEIVDRQTVLVPLIFVACALLDMKHFDLVVFDVVQPSALPCPPLLT